MPHYMVQWSLTPETWGKLVQAPEDRAAAVGRIIEGLGGKLEAFYYTFGADDGVAITELPDNVTQAALSMAIAASGALRNLRTTPLLTVQEAMEAMRKAGHIGFRPPGAE